MSLQIRERVHVAERIPRGLYSGQYGQSFSSLSLGLTWNATLMARHTGSILFVAHLTSLIISAPGNRRNAFRRLQCFGVTKLDFWGPNSAGNMDPIVVRGPLEWFPGVDGAIHLFLLLAVKVRSFPSLLNLEAFSLTILLRHLLFVMCYFRLFHEIMFCIFNGTKNTLIMLGRR